MAFRNPNKKQTFTARVDVETPNDHGGHDKSWFNAKFHRTTTRDMERLRGLTQADVMRDRLAGWSGFEDGDGKEIPFKPETVEILIDIPEALYGLTKAFWDNVIKAREKN